MSLEPLYSAVVCTLCQRASLVPEKDPKSGFCASCGATSFQVPGAKFVHGELKLFAALERVVHDAELSKSEATLIAAELEGVGARWEPPELVLQHISTRLDGLQAVYDPKQEYSHLLLVVGMLLTIVCARMIGGAPARNHGLRRPSGIRPRALDSDTVERSTRSRKSR